MKRVIFLFLDGVGLGSDDPAVNPLAAAHYPTLSALMDGHPLTAASGRLTTPHAELIPTDAHLGIPGRPQSATGQAAIVTGANVPARLGRHYGPRPNQPVRDVIDEGSIFSRLRDRGQSSFFCNAYPEGFFAAVNRGKRLLSAIPYAVTQTGQVLPDHEDLRAGRALSADFTGQGWRSQLSYADAPVYTPEAAGRKLWALSQPHHFVFFEHWLTDILGHKQAHAEAVANFQVIDGFLAGLMAAADLAETSIILAADHGNVEDCSHRAHTENPALTLLLRAGRAEMAGQIHGLDDFAPAIEGFLRLG